VKGGGKLSPSLLYKEPPWRRVGHTWIEGVPWKSYPLVSPSCASPIPSLSLSCGSPKGFIGARSNPLLHTVVLREFWIRSKTDLLPQSRLDQRDRKKSSFTVFVQVLGGAALVSPGHSTGIFALVSLRRDLHDLEVGYVDFIINDCVNPRDRSTRVLHRSS
jgi:hypothetical protein